MGLIQSSVSNSLGPGVYGVVIKPATTLSSSGGDTCLILEQFQWGPANTYYQPTDMGDTVLTYFPPGTNRGLAGPLALSRKGWPRLYVFRVMAASGTATATATVSSATPTLLFTVNAKYPGTLANSFTRTVAAASNGIATSCNLTVQLTGASGTTTDTLTNVDTTSAANLLASVQGQLPTCRLVGSLTWSASGNPAAGSASFSGGLDGSVAATDYVGTAGTGDKGLAATEGLDDVGHVFYGDPGNSLRATCNAGLQAHVISLGRRCAYMTGPSGQSASAAQTDVASYRADQNFYIDPWMKQISDQDSTLQTIPAAAMAASVAAQLSPSTHISWRDSSVAGLMTAVADVEANRGAQALTNDANGIITLIRKKRGGFAFYTDPTSNKPVNPAQPTMGETRMTQYILTAAEDGFQSQVNGPNVPATQDPMRTSLTSFMETLIYNRDHDPAHNPYVKSYSLGDPVASNPQASLDAGNYSLPVTAKTDQGMVRVFIPLTIGPTATP